MRLLEFEAKKLLSDHGIRTPAGVLVKAGEVADRLDFPVMLKAQVPIGGRGKAGGVIEAASLAEAGEKVAALLEKPLKGFIARSVLLEKRLTVAKEYFLAVTYDAVAKLPLAIFSTEGGVDIEALAARQPEKVKKRHFSARWGLQPHQAREMVSEAGISGSDLLGISGVLQTMARLFLHFDCTVLEINPLVKTEDGTFVALDCHAEIEDDALFRQKAYGPLEKQPDRYKALTGSTEFERKAAEIDSLDHRGVAGRVIEFDGDLGLIIGGGGASLTAFDAIQQHGGRPANYCEIGGNPSVHKVKELTKHILSKPGVEKISVIMNVVSNTRVDLIARGLIKGVLEAGKEPSKTIAVFRVPGAWEQEGFKILDKYGVPYCDRTVSIDEAAGLAVERAAG
jgi:succinyl-CoA synthetase beta subunit